MLRFLRWVWRLIRNFVDNDLHNHAAEMAYFAIMSVFPFFLLLLTGVAFLDIPNLFDQVMGIVETVAPAAVVQLLEKTIYNVINEQNTNLLSLTAVVAVWWSLGAMSSTTRGLNKAFGMLDPRHYVHFFGLSILLNIMLGLILVIAIVLIMLGPVIHNEFTARFDVGWLGDIMFLVFRYGVAVFFLLSGHAGIYWLCPAVERRFRLITPGSIFSVFGWVLVSYALQLYLSRFNNFNKIYGSLGAVILTLFYFYLMSFVLLLGGQIDAMLHPEYRARTQSNGQPPPDYVLSRFPMKLAISTLAVIAIAVIAMQFLVTPDLFTPNPQEIQGPIGEAIKKAVAGGTSKAGHDEFSALLWLHVDDDGRVDYAGLGRDRAALEKYLERLNKMDLASLDKKHVLASMLNLYNATVLKLIVDNFKTIDSVKDIQNYTSRRTIVLADQRISLGVLEHDIIRAFFDEPRARFAISRGHRGLPKLQRFAFDGENLDDQLERVSREVLGSLKTNAAGDKVLAPRLLQDYSKDFAVQGKLTPFLLKYVVDEAARKLLLEQGDSALQFIHVDWSLNQKI